MRKAELDYLIKELNDTKKLLSDALEKVGWLEASIIEEKNRQKIDCRSCDHGFHHTFNNGHGLMSVECIHPDRPDDCSFNIGPDVPGWCPRKDEEKVDFL